MEDRRGSGGSGGAGAGGGAIAIVSNGSVAVGGQDITMIASSWLQATPSTPQSGTGNSTIAPEPSSFVLAALAALGLLLLRSAIDGTSTLQNVR